MKNLILILFMSLVTATSAFSAEPKDTTDRKDAFVQHIEALNKQYVDAAKAGDLEKWLSLKEKSEADKLRGNPAVTPDMLKQFAGQMPDYSTFEFVELKVKNNTVRVLYSREKEGVLIFSGDFFVQQEGGWKYKEGLEETIAGDGAKNPAEALQSFLAKPQMQFPQ